MVLDYTTETRHYVAYTTNKKYSVNHNIYETAVLREGDYLYVIAEYDDPSLGYPGPLLKCIYNGTTYYFNEISGWDMPVCRIPYQPDGYTSIKVYSKDSDSNPLQFNGSLTTYYSLSFRDCDTIPYLSFSPELYADFTNTLTIDQNPGDSGHFGAVYALTLYMRAPGETEFTATTLLSKSTDLQYTLALGDVVGYDWYMVLNFRTYDEDDWYNSYSNYVTVSFIETPIRTITRSGTVPLPPSAVHTGMLLAGSKVTVSWDAVYDTLVPVENYTLERSVDGVSFVTLYTGTSLQYPDTIPMGVDFILYRLRTNGQNGVSSSWYTTDALPIIKSNMYIGTEEKIRIVSSVHIGSHRASPLAIVG